MLIKIIKGSWKVTLLFENCLLFEYIFCLKSYKNFICMSTLWRHNFKKKVDHFYVKIFVAHLWIDLMKIYMNANIMTIKIFVIERFRNFYKPSDLIKTLNYVLVDSFVLVFNKLKKLKKKNTLYIIFASKIIMKHFII